MQQRISVSKPAIILAFIFTALLLAACGGNTASNSGEATSVAASNATLVAVPTMPAGSFKAAGENQITKTVNSTGTQATTQTTATQANPDDLKRGATIYAKNKCNDCHGEKGEVVSGKTTKVIGGTTLSATDFDQFLRTGGGLGDTHIFGPSAISPGGIQALYAYVKSLPGK